MLKFISMVFLVVLAFCAGRMYGSQPPVSASGTICARKARTKEIAFAMLNNAQIIGFIRETHQQPDSFSKITKIQVLVNILRARGVIS